jgi:hypothetical protein
MCGKGIDVLINQAGRQAGDFEIRAPTGASGRAAGQARPLPPCLLTTPKLLPPSLHSTAFAGGLLLLLL